MLIATVFAAAGSSCPAQTLPDSKGITAPKVLAENPKSEYFLPVRELYGPAHFGNAYEVMSADEMVNYLGDMKWMGFNSYSDWLTSTDVNDPYSVGQADEKGTKRFEKKKAVYLAAQKAGLELNVILCPNHVYLNQLKEDGIAATKSKRIFGQLICPSTPRGREIILANNRNWFADTAKAGIRFKTLTAFAYDYGGCACDKCAPWILTSAELTREIYEIAKEYHPDIEPWYCSWWWTERDHELFNEWAEKQAPGWLKGLTMHIEYGQTRPKNVPVPEGCRKLAFVHIGYSEQGGYATYGKMGAVYGHRRIPATIRELRKLGFDGYQAYSEGVFDDVNKMVLAGLASGRFPNSEAALKAYATRFLGADEQDAHRWVELLRQCVDPSNPAELRKELDSLAAKVPSNWRIEQWGSRLLLAEFSQTQDANRFLDAQENLYKNVYRLGRVDHVLNPAVGRPGWAVRTVDGWNESFEVPSTKKAIAIRAGATVGNWTLQKGASHSAWIVHSASEPQHAAAADGGQVLQLDHRNKPSGLVYQSLGKAIKAGDITVEAQFAGRDHNFNSSYTFQLLLLTGKPGDWTTLADSGPVTHAAARTWAKHSVTAKRVPAGAEVFVGFQANYLHANNTDVRFTDIDMLTVNGEAIPKKAKTPARTIELLPEQ